VLTCPRSITTTRTCSPSSRCVSRLAKYDVCCVFVVSLLQTILSFVCTHTYNHAVCLRSLFELNSSLPPPPLCKVSRIVFLRLLARAVRCRPANVDGNVDGVMWCVMCSVMCDVTLQQCPHAALSDHVRYFRCQVREVVWRYDAMS
jgi:hypothetical protein